MANDPLVSFNYSQGFKRTIVSSLRPMFSQPDFPIDDLRGHVYVGLEYPLENVQYPAIYITFQESQLRSAGVGHREEFITEDGITQHLKHWIFTGSVNFNILALSPEDRDKLASVLINILAFGDANSWLTQFQDAVFNSNYIALQYLQEVIHPGGEQIGDVPWQSETETVFGVNYAIDVVGEFYSNPITEEMMRVEHVDVYPYRTSEDPHW